jgi:hypothetical protein
MTYNFSPLQQQGVELYLGGAGERPPTSSSSTWGTRGRAGVVVWPGQRRTSEGGGRAGVDVETRRPGGGGPVRVASKQRRAGDRALLKGVDGGGPRRRRVVRQGGGGGPTRRLELTGDGRHRQQAVVVGGRWWSLCGSSVWRRRECA